jgi:aryl-alcohol dehydrogenase-like predicted oxidoreductase
VQSPFNIVDRRLAESGWLHRLNESGTEVHVRSIFLQGLLLMPAAARPAKFRQWQPLWDSWHRWLQETRQTPVQACLGFALSPPEVARIVVGVDSLPQLQEILRAVDAPCTAAPRALMSDDPNLINPSRWSAN